MNNKHQPLEYTALEVADILRHALSNVLQRLPEDDRGRWLDVREQCDASLRAIRGLEEPQDGPVTEVLDLAHAYADAKLMRYGLLGIRNSPDPQAAFEALREAVVSAVVVQPAIPDIYVHTDGLSVWGAAANPELANDPAFTAYYSIPPSTNRALRMALGALDVAKSGLEWYRDACPKSVDGSDAEADQQIDEARAAVCAVLREPDVG